MTSIKTAKERNELVVQSNELLRKTRYELNTVEQKLLIYLISKVEKGDTDLKTVEMSISDYLRVCGNNISGENYEYVKNTLEKLSNKSWWINIGRSQILFRWVDTAKIDPDTHKLIIKLSYSLKPYVLELKENFTKYQLINVLALRSKYAVRLYEILKSYEWQSYWIVSVEELREILQIGDKYKAHKDFRKRVLTPALTEINELTDLIITYEQRKDGRNISEIKFRIRAKRGIEECYKAMENCENRLK